MDFAPNQSDSSHRRHTNGNTHSKNNHDAELDLTNDESHRSIFATDSSKVFEINELERSRNSG
jgi:hypothetical protein